MYTKRLVDLSKLPSRVTNHERSLFFSHLTATTSDEISGDFFLVLFKVQNLLHACDLDYASLENNLNYIKISRVNELVELQEIKLKLVNFLKGKKITGS